MKYVDKIRNELPVGWKIVQLEEILERITNGTTEKQSQEPPGLPVTRIETISHGVIDLEKVRYLRDLDEEKREKFTLQEGDILFSHINSDLHLGKTAVVNKEKDLIHGMNLLLLRFNEEANPQYMNYLFNLVRARGEFIAIAQHAVNQSSLNQGKIKAIEVPLAPPEQQKRIVAKIEELFSHIDAGIEALKKAKQLLKQYRQSVLKAAVTGELTKEWREANKDKLEPASKLLERILKERRQKWEEQQLEQFKAKGKMPKNEKWKEKYKESQFTSTKDAGLLPNGWRWTVVSQVANVVSGQTPKGIAENQGEGEIPWFKVGDMNTSGNEKYMHESDVMLSLDEVCKLKINIQPENTIIFPKRGGAIATNKKRILAKPSAYDLNTMGISPVIVDLGYIWTWFLGIDLASLSDGSNVPQINHKDIDPLDIPLPPLDEQNEIARVAQDKLEAIERLNMEIDHQQKKAERNKQAILATAFSGRLQ